MKPEEGAAENSGKCSAINKKQVRQNLLLQQQMLFQSRLGNKHESKFYGCL